MAEKKGFVSWERKTYQLRRIKSNMPKKTNKKVVKKVKAWAILSKTGKLENDAFFNGGDCCCAGEPQAVAIYDKKKTAEECIFYKENFIIAPCEIIIHLPNK